MKQINYSLLLAFTGCVFAFSSCKKNTTAAIPIPQIAATSISLKFSGGGFNSITAVAIYDKNSGAMKIGGLFGTNAFVNLFIPNVKVGSFDLSGGYASLSFSNGAKGLDTFLSTSGSAVISEFSNTTIIGTFEFTGIDSLNVSRQITEGQFTTSYTKQ